MIQGAEEVTRGVDVVPSMRAENLRRLELALGDLGATTIKGKQPVLGEETRSPLELMTDRGEVKVVPDEVLLEFKVVSNDKALAAAKTANDATTRAVLGLARVHAIAAEAFKITNLTVAPDYDDKHQFLGYEFTRSFEVTLHDFRKIEPLLEGLFKAGVDHIDTMTFRLRDQTQALVEARRQAVASAKVKAASLADLIGMKLGSALNIQEYIQQNQNVGGIGGMASLPRGRGGPMLARVGRFHTATLRQDAPPPVQANPPGAPADLLLAPGQIALKFDVHIEYELIKP